MGQYPDPGLSSLSLPCPKALILFHWIFFLSITTARTWPNLRSVDKGDILIQHTYLSNAFGMVWANSQSSALEL